MCVVKPKKTIQWKINDRGNVGSLVGNPDNHANDVYRIFNIKTKAKHQVKDLVWITLSIGNWDKSKSNDIQPQDNEDTSDTEATTEVVIDLAKPEDASLDDSHIMKQNKALKQKFKIKKLVYS